MAWRPYLDEPMTGSEWRAHLRMVSDSDLDELCNTPFASARFDAELERDRRREMSGE